MKEPNVHVGILFEPQIKFALLTPYRINGMEIIGKQTVTYHDGRILWNGKPYDELLFEPANGASASIFELSEVTIGINFHWERKETQRFQGALKIIVEDGKLTGINILCVEDYLTSVISSEMSATASPELLKAHAVISRSWLLACLSPDPSPVERGADTQYYQTANRETDTGCYQTVERGADTRYYQTANRGNYAVLRENQKRQKEQPTEAEKVIWERLRSSLLGVKFRRQHIIDDYIADFVSLEKKLIIEIDGEYHTSSEQQAKDRERTARLEASGYRVLRFTNNEVIAQPDSVAELIKATIEQLSPPSTKEETAEKLVWYDRENHTHFDVCADDHCQRYQGITRASTEAVKQAIAATHGQVLLFNGKICDARFSKCCGGILEEFQYCWEDTKHPYLIAKYDTPSSSPTPQGPPTHSAAPPLYGRGAGGEAWIRTSPAAFCNTTDKKILSQVLNNYDQETTDFYRWKVTYTQEELAALIRKRTGVDYGQIIDLIPIARGTSARLWKLKIVGTKKTLVIGKELEIRRTLSPSHLYSSAFVVDKEEVSPEGIPGRFILTGAGWGHGVGLCQIGAAVMGEQGYKYDAILLHYYIGASIDKLY